MKTFIVLLLLMGIVHLGGPDPHVRGNGDPHFTGTGGDPH